MEKGKVLRRKAICYNTDSVMNKYIVSDPNIMGGAPVIKGTRIPIEVILHRLKEGNSVAAIHKMYAWVGKKTLTGAIDEAIQTVTTTLHA
jgi:uncharacterized protein (DUF433 family)